MAQTQTRPGASTARPAAPARPRRPAPWPVQFYRTAVGKKWVMALTGIALMGFVLVHMAGNLKLYLGPANINEYGEGLRELGEPLVPRTNLLWLLRFGLIALFALHIHAAYTLTRMNWRARPTGYASKRDYIAVTFASRTMRWTGIIIGLYLLFHLADLTWGWWHPDFVRGDVYNNVVESLSRWPVALLYIVANLALGVHLYHGAWSIFQSLGVNSPRYNGVRRAFAGGFAFLVAAANVTFPVMVLAGVIE